MAEETDKTDGNSAESTPQLADFEASLSELETLVETLESGDIGLETALAKFERGVTLTRQCRDLLKNAELHVDQLLADSDEAQAMAASSEAPGAEAGDSAS